MSKQDLCESCRVPHLRHCRRKGIDAAMPSHSIGIEGCTRCDQYEPDCIEALSVFEQFPEAVAP